MSPPSRTRAGRNLATTVAGKGPLDTSVRKILQIKSAGLTGFATALIRTAVPVFMMILANVLKIVKQLHIVIVPYHIVCNYKPSDL